MWGCIGAGRGSTGRGTSRLFGMVATWESWDSPWTDNVLTMTSLASRH